MRPSCLVSSASALRAASVSRSPCGGRWLGLLEGLLPRSGSLYFSSPRFLSASTWICPPDLPFSAGVLSPCGFRRPPCGRAVRVRLLHLPVVSRLLAPRTSRPLPRRVLSRATPPLVIAAAQPFPLPVLASACAPLSIALADRPCQRSLLHSPLAPGAGTLPQLRRGWFLTAGRVCRGSDCSR